MPYIEHSPEHKQNIYKTYGGNVTYIFSKLTLKTVEYVTLYTVSSNKT